SLLRHPLAVSAIEDFTKGGLQEVIDDPEVMVPAEAAEIRKVVLCSGKFYYDLIAERTASKAHGVAIVRVEQLYPFPAWKLESVLKRYPKAKTIVWAQEEPRNMGAWQYIFNLWMGGTGKFSEQAGGRAIQFVGRQLAAAPAVGPLKAHEPEQKSLVQEALQ
ncbi:MAG: 2-oxoglutarate dehydrogenase E1 component, partial [Bdellovibrionota bacterium]